MKNSLRRVKKEDDEYETDFTERLRKVS